MSIFLELIITTSSAACNTEISQLPSPQGVSSTPVTLGFTSRLYKTSS